LNSSGDHRYPLTPIGVPFTLVDIIGCCDLVTYIPGYLLPKFWPLAKGPWLRHGQEAYIDMLQNPPLGFKLSDTLLEMLFDTSNIRGILGSTVDDLLTAVGNEHKMGTYYDWMKNLPGHWGLPPEKITWEHVKNW